MIRIFSNTYQKENNTKRNNNNNRTIKYSIGNYYKKKRNEVKLGRITMMGMDFSI